MSSTNFAADDTAADSVPSSDIYENSPLLTTHTAALRHINHHKCSEPEDNTFKRVKRATSDERTMLEFSLGFRIFTFDPISNQPYRKQRRLYNSELASTVLKSNGTSPNVKKLSCSNESNTLSLQVDGDSQKIITECCKRGIMSTTDILHIDSLYFLYTERTSNNRWENTPAHGYCAFISLAQLYLLYIQNNMIQLSEACILDRTLSRNDRLYIKIDQSGIMLLILVST